MLSKTLSSTLTLILDTALNRWLQLDPYAPQTLRRLQDNVICLHITGLEFSLYFFPSENGIYSMTDYEGEVDAKLSTPPATLLKLATAEDGGKVILESDAVTLQGSIGILESFMALISGANIDWEELLSKVVGDIVANQVGESLRQTKGWLDESRTAMQMNMGEYLQEESRLTPADAEVSYYLDQVDQLRADTERLDARIQRLDNHARTLANQRKPS